MVQELAALSLCCDFKKEKVFVVKGELLGYLEREDSDAKLTVRWARPFKVKKSKNIKRDCSGLKLRGCGGRAAR